MTAALGEAAAAVRFLTRLPGFLRHRLTLEQARAALRRRQEQREADFLSLVQHAVYEHPRSPYGPLLQRAGCEYGDLERLVRQGGVEGAMRALFRQGVYVTVDEFKGRRPLARGNVTVDIDPGRLRNSLSASHVLARTSGSRSPGTAVAFDLDFIQTCAVNTALALETRGGSEWVKADWEVPGVGGTFRLLKFSSFGAPVARWFSHAHPAALSRYRWNAHALRWAGRMAGVPLPQAEHAPIDAPWPVLRWMSDTLRAGRTPHLFAFASSAVRLAQAALDAGVDLRGAQIMAVGEPVTVPRLAAIRRSGAEAVPRYGSIETGPVGYACLAPKAADDVHVLDDLHALIQPETEEDTTRTGRPLFITSLRQTAPYVLLNVSMGDHGVIEKLHCGCRMEQLGWGTHLHSIRSYEKLTAGGLTFLDTDVIRVLEETLPRQFGGKPTDYQILEGEAEDGQPRVRLLVDPAVGVVDAEAVVKVFLAGIGGGGALWQQAGFLSVERRPALSTSSGKILHLHVQRRVK